MRVLILCTGNSARSQMAEGFLRAMHPDWHVRSAGTAPAPRVNPLAIRVMAERGVDISAHWPKHVDLFPGEAFDYVVTVCGSADQACPPFLGDVKHRLHIGFDDPAAATGSDAQILAEFRRIRNEIQTQFKETFQ